MTAYASKRLTHFTPKAITNEAVNAICENVANIMLEKINNTTDITTVSLELQDFGAGGISNATACDVMSLPSEEMACVRGVLKDFPFVNPAGVTAMAAAILEPFCDNQ